MANTSQSSSVSRSYTTGRPPGYYTAMIELNNNSANRDIARITGQYNLMAQGLQVIGGALSQGFQNYYQFKLEQNRIAEETRRWDLGYQLEKTKAAQETQRLQFELDDLQKAAESEKQYRGPLSEFLSMALNASSYGDIDADEMAGRLTNLQREYYNMAPAERDAFNQARTELEKIRIGWDDGKDYSLLQTVNAARKPGTPMYYSALAALATDSHFSEDSRKQAANILEAEATNGASTSNRASATFARDRARAYRNAMSISPETGRAFLSELNRTAAESGGDPVAMRRVLDEFQFRHDSTVDPGKAEDIAMALSKDHFWGPIQAMKGVGVKPQLASLSTPEELASAIRSGISLGGRSVSDVSKRNVLIHGASKVVPEWSGQLGADMLGLPSVRSDFELYTRRFFKAAAQANSQEEFNMSIKWAEDMAGEWAKYQRDNGLIDDTQIEKTRNDFLADIIGNDNVIRRALYSRERAYSRSSQKTVELFSKLHGRTSYSYGVEAPARDAVPAAAVPQSLMPKPKGVE